MVSSKSPHAVGEEKIDGANRRAPPERFEAQSVEWHCVQHDGITHCEQIIHSMRKAYVCIILITSDTQHVIDRLFAT